MDTRGRLNRLSKKQEIFRMNQSQCLLFQRSKFSIKSFEQIFCIVYWYFCTVVIDTFLQTQILSNFAK